MWLNKKAEDSLVLEDEPCSEIGEVCNQVSRYPEVKAEAIEKVNKVLEEDTLLSATIYHRRLNLIG
jgi:hypothetical protein